ncbi:hypothetical protein [Halodurantibacterium flavum]|uniref:Uncharacterized protein n=1 Tax=Halodurantibacterium flavum TaxID=1382802 RepID=A0ABW4S4C7_9RHOB
MLEYLPQDLREAIAAAHRREQRRKGRLCVHVNGAVYPILRWWEDGFALDGRLAPQLRGHVDVYDGPRHICRGLIVASLDDGEEVVCEFKRNTMVGTTPPLDFIREGEAPAGFIPRF